jgi:putative N-acetylmannosamine-6-phosphate epimerase
MKIRRRKLTLSSTRRQQIDDETINNIVSEEQKAALIDMVQAAIVEEMLEMHQYNISIIVDELFQYYLQKTNENEYKNNDGNDIANDHETNQKMIAVAQSMLNEDDIAYGDGIDNFMGDL